MADSSRQSLAQKTIVAVVLAVLAIVVLRWLSVPCSKLRQVQLATEPLASEIAALEREQRELKRQLRDLHAPHGIVAEAHRKGFILPGERLVDVTEPPAPAALSPATPQGPALFTRMHDWIKKRL